MTDWMLHGEGAHKVMKRLNDMGIRTKDGNTFTSDAVRKLMRRETIAGMFVYNRRYVHKGKELIRPEEEWIVAENHHEPIIDKETFERLQMANKARSTGHKDADNERWLLSGLVYCTHCGSKMVGRYKKKPSGREYFHYVCSNYLKKAACFHHYIERNTLEDYVIQNLLNARESFLKKGAESKEIKDIPKLHEELLSGDRIRLKNSIRLAVASIVITKASHINIEYRNGI